MMLLTSQALLWVVVLALAVVVLALARQIGVLHERIAPVGALALAQGPQAGEAAPKLLAGALSGARVRIGGVRDGGRSQLLFFLSPTCPICKALLPTVQRFVEAERLDLLAVGDGDFDQHRKMAQRFGLDEGQVVVSPEIGQAFRVGKLPYAVLIDARGTIAAQGLVNTREHLESLANAPETGFRSVQDFLVARRPTPIHAEEPVARHG